MYESPIELIRTQMKMALDNEIFKAVQNVGVNVDKEELLKTLQYDRSQYQKGYDDRDSEIVRCKDCAYAFFKEGLVKHGHIVCTKPYTERWQAIKQNNWFCADGKRKESR